MEQKFYSLREFRTILGVSAQTVRNWDISGKLKPHHINANGYRYYSKEQLQNIICNKSNDKYVIGYCRVSSRKQTDDLDRQVDLMNTYLSKYYNDFKIIKDIDSGINYNKKGLNELLHLINSEEISKIVILHKDRLLRFGFELIENLCNMHNISIEIIDNSKKTDEEELVEDMIQIITVFSCRLHGKRANQAKRIIKEIKSDD